MYGLECKSKTCGECYLEEQCDHVTWVCLNGYDGQIIKIINFDFKMYICMFYTKHLDGHISFEETKINELQP